MSYAKKKEMVAMLLAGGQGSRLGVLTQSVAKPAVPFGGKYRIIDFPLSNCINSGIDTVGVLTQYRPLELNSYIGSGQPWDLDRIYGGVFILPPYVTGKSGEWYKGTANAIFQNMQFIEMFDPEYVLVLSGDHIYKMDYEEMLEAHKETGADCTIAVLRVPWEEAGRFGVMSVEKDLRIFEFEEKPAEPRSNLASMGVYIFNWKKLKEYLIKDEEDPDSQNDFGKNVIPAMLLAGERMYAFEHKGYWKDVGTVESLWEANMDLLDPNVPMELYDPQWRIYSRNLTLPAQYVAEHAKLENCKVSEGCYLDGTVRDSIVFPGVTIEEGAEVYKSVIMEDTVIHKGAKVSYAIVSPEVVVGSGAEVGDALFEKDEEILMRITVIGQGAEIGEGAILPAGTVIKEGEGRSDR